MSNEIITIPEFTEEEFLNSTKPYEWLYQFKDNKLKLKQMQTLLSKKAQELKIKNFIALSNEYLKSTAKNTGILINNVTEFEGQEMELDSGNWFADDHGITSVNQLGIPVEACSHPIMPIQRLVNIETGTVKLKLAYKLGKFWNKIIVDRKILASANTIVQLSDYGIMVNSENARYLVKYISDLESLNYEKIEEIKTITRLGWVDDYGFSPYVEDLVFDGDDKFKEIYDSVKSSGDFQKWVELAKRARKESKIARIMLASSFASVLIAPCCGLPFFVHLWGNSGTGKTVAIMLSASVWANPSRGYMRTFNSTNVALELFASFVNSMPLVIDELQIIKDKKDFDNIIYQLAEGVGRSRGHKAGGLQRVGTWKNCILTTGEYPISNSSSGSGAMNRIIEINCESNNIFQNPKEVIEIINENYGQAGKIFINKLQEEGNINYAKELQTHFYEGLIDYKDNTEKQTLSASLILTADKLINEWIFQDDCTISISEINEHLISKRDIDQQERCLEFLYNIVAQNNNKFVSEKNMAPSGEIWGEVDRAENKIYFIKSVFDDVLKNNGYNSAAFLSWAANKDILEHEKGKRTKKKRLYGTPINCICLKIMEMNDEKVNITHDELPI